MNLLCLFVPSFTSKICTVYSVGYARFVNTYCDSAYSEFMMCLLEDGLRFVIFHWLTHYFSLYFSKYSPLKNAYISAHFDEILMLYHVQFLVALTRCKKWQLPSLYLIVHVSSLPSFLPSSAWNRQLSLAEFSWNFVYGFLQKCVNIFWFALNWA